MLKISLIINNIIFKLCYYFFLGLSYLFPFINRKKLKIKLEKRLDTPEVSILLILYIVTFLSASRFLIPHEVLNNKKSDVEITSINTIDKNSSLDSNDISSDNLNGSSQNTVKDYYKSFKSDSDLLSLMAINNNIKGFIRVDSTNISYPFLQFSDNSYYLEHDLFNNYNAKGYIFLDYRNDSNISNNYNTILYGHHLLNKTMFGTLKNTITENWFNNIDNRIVKVSTNDYNYLYEVFSTYKIENENYYLKTKFSSDDDYKAFLNLLSSRSIFNYNVPLDENDKIITLSTCSSNNKKIVLHAKLIKTQKKDH